MKAKEKLKRMKEEKKDEYYEEDEERKKKRKKKRRKRTEPASVRWELKIINQIESQMGWW